MANLDSGDGLAENGAAPAAFELLLAVCGSNGRPEDSQEWLSH